MISIILVQKIMKVIQSTITWTINRRITSNTSREHRENLVLVDLSFVLDSEAFSWNLYNRKGCTNNNFFFQKAFVYTMRKLEPTCSHFQAGLHALHHHAPNLHSIQMTKIGHVKKARDPLTTIHKKRSSKTKTIF